MNLRDYERESIRAFVEKAGTLGYLKGRVLDYGAGRMPYRDLVESFGAKYEAYDRQAFPGALFEAGDIGDLEAYYDAILCTQVVQYVPIEFETDDGGGLQDMLAMFRGMLRNILSGDIPPERQTSERGYLVMTYPTNWPEVEAEDLHRFTQAGMERLLTEAGFEIVLHQARGSVWDPQFETARNKRVRATGEEFVLGYGVVAKA